MSDTDFRVVGRHGNGSRAEFTNGGGRFVHVCPARCCYRERKPGGLGYTRHEISRGGVLTTVSTLGLVARNMRELCGWTYLYGRVCKEKTMREDVFGENIL